MYVILYMNSRHWLNPEHKDLWYRPMPLDDPHTYTTPEQAAEEVAWLHIDKHLDLETAKLYRLEEVEITPEIQAAFDGKLKELREDEEATFLPEEGNDG